MSPYGVSGPPLINEINLLVRSPDPDRMLITPGGKPALTTNSANFRDVSGVTWKETEVKQKLIDTLQN